MNDEPAKKAARPATAAAELLIDAFGRVSEEFHRVADGLTVDQGLRRLDPEANSIVWLLWHLARVQDDHLAAAAGTKQVWTGKGWANRFDLPIPDEAVGYGHSTQDVALVKVDSIDLITGYHDAVHEATVAFLGGLADADFDRIVDERWDPPVTLGVRVVSVLSDTLQHVGQAAIIRGIVVRAEK